MERLYYNKRSKKSLKRALIERMYNLELVEQRTEKGSWKAIMKHLEELVEHAIEGVKDRGEGNYGCDLHNYIFNEDYYIIGTALAKEWIEKNGGVFEAIEAIKQYEQFHFGDCSTDFSSPENVVNMFVYIKGEEILSESSTLSDKWNNTLDEKDVENIVEELQELL